MAVFFQFPQGRYANEQPYWLNFNVASYSLINTQRTRASIASRRFAGISLPLPRDVGYSMTHEFGETARTPIVASQVVESSVANNGGSKNIDQIIAREDFAASAFIGEYNSATSTFRRFSNITELTMVTEARKRYSFEYLLVPKNASESIAISNIVGTFRRSSYPTVAGGLPERTYPQNLWSLNVSKNINVTTYSNDLTRDWLGEPLPCVLRTVTVKKNDKADPVVRVLPDGYSNITLLGLVFEEFETGSYDGREIKSKSEISADSFGNTPVT
jgi:hypothetical protein